jgi:hypothetical protein
VGGGYVYELESEPKLKPIAMWVQWRYMHISGITDGNLKVNIKRKKRKEKESKKKNAELPAVVRAEDEECIAAQAVEEQQP